MFRAQLTKTADGRLSRVVRMTHQQSITSCANRSALEQTGKM
jgi:hypothetical protein